MWINMWIQYVTFHRNGFLNQASFTLMSEKQILFLSAEAMFSDVDFSNVFTETIVER